MNQPKTEEMIFCEALDVPASQRAEYLQHACGGNAELLASVESLLRLHDTEEDFLATPAIGVAPMAIDEQPGDRIGCYLLINKIGEGGFGVVWQAEQREPIKRKVALKIVKLGMDSETIIDRFDDERQTLAMMNHPNIAMVLDAGLTDGGRPYFAMELVEGSSIDRFCNENECSIDEQLRMFVTVCRAVQHAHQKGVVHRDLKPSNILVAKSEDQVVPKVIDFGIATAVQSDNAESIAKSDSPLVGTPKYMSPEQWRNETDIDTRSDIYSLGVVLYRLLAGSVPQLEMQTVTQATPDPSQWRIRPSELNNNISEDLDWITSKAMSFDRNHRYQSASEFAMDLERYLAGQVVVAHPGGTGYFLKKFIRRNKIAVLSSVVTVIAMLVGICASTWGYVYANEQRAVADQQKWVAQNNEKEAVRLKEIAQEEARKLRVVANVLKNLLPEANPFRGMKSGFEIREHLDQLLSSVDSLSSEPELEADVRITAARVYENLARFGRARFQYSQAREIRRKVLGEEHPKTLLCLAGMAACNIELGRLESADDMIQEVLEKSEGRAPRTHINALRVQRRIRTEQKRHVEAFEIAEQFRELSKDVYAQEIFGQIHVANEYSIAAMKMGLIEEAEKIVRHSLKVLERDHPERKFVTANTKHRLAEILMEAKQLDEAKFYANSFVEMQKVTLGENDTYVIMGLAMLSEIHRRQDDMLVAEQIALDAVERAESLEKDKVKIRRTAHRQLAKVLEKLDLERSAIAWDKTNEYSWQFLGGNVSVAKDFIRSARIYEKLEQWANSASRLKRAIDILEHRKNTKDKLIETYRDYSRILNKLGRSELAEEYALKAADLSSKQ